MLSRVLRARFVSSTRVTLQKAAQDAAKGASQSGKTVVDVDAALAKAHANSELSLSSSELIYKPELWKGLPPSVVIQLYRARVIALGKSYKRSQAELDAILETATNPLEADVLYNVYNSTEADIFKADSDTDYENYVVEGEYMEDKLEGYKFDEYPTAAQDIVRDFRDVMEFNRKAAFELPQLAKFRQEYVPVDSKEKPIVYKYTRFIGEAHPAERKVALQFKVADLNLAPAEAHKLKLLAGTRYNYLDDVVLMSCEKYLEPAQNAAFMDEILQDLVAEAKRNPEEFASVPLDKRHIEAKLGKSKRKNKQTIPFPKDWERPMTAAQRAVKLDDFVPGPQN